MVSNSPSRGPTGRSFFGYDWFTLNSPAPSAVKPVTPVNYEVETLADESGAALWYYPKSKIVHHEVRRFLHGAELRATLDKSFEAFTKYRATKWLSDDRGGGPLALSDAEWVANDWAPRMRQGGWRYWASISPKKASAEQMQAQVRRWMEKHAKHIVVAKEFPMPEAALAWLENPTARWSMFFWRDPLHDVVTMTFSNCVIETQEDATDFMRVVFGNMQRHKTPTDVLIDYSGLVIKPKAARQFGLERAEFARRYVKRSYRYSVTTTSSRTAIFTSSVLAGAQTNVYTSREEALGALLAQRVQEPMPGDDVPAK